MVTGIYASPDSSPGTNTNSKNHHAKQAGALFPFCLTQSLLLTSRVLDNPFTLLFSSQPRLKNTTYYYLLRSTLYRTGGLSQYDCTTDLVCPSG